ncbi:diacylglycerol kinase family protein [candidate division KSB1 bacterium]|nr:diacylglycerol kinase family protein [candidate division KSB1 bacterium]
MQFIHTRIKSFKYAFQGIFLLLTTQPNAWLHALASIVVILLGFYFKITKAEWSWLVLTMIFVWMAEAFNSAIEFLSDAITKQNHPLIGKAKDLAAGAVLIAAIGAVVMGILIFGPYLM